MNVIRLETWETRTGEFNFRRNYVRAFPLFENDSENQREHPGYYQTEYRDRDHPLKLRLPVETELPVPLAAFRLGKHFLEEMRFRNEPPVKADNIKCLVAREKDQESYEYLQKIEVIPYGIDAGIDKDCQKTESDGRGAAPRKPPDMVIVPVQIKIQQNGEASAALFLLSVSIKLSLIDQSRQAKHSTPS